jgi:hypothetical protein
VEEAQMTAAARAQADGHLVYPAAQAPQQDLFKS